MSSTTPALAQLFAQAHQGVAAASPQNGAAPPLLSVPLGPEASPVPVEGPPPPAVAVQSGMMNTPVAPQAPAPAPTPPGAPLTEADLNNAKAELLEAQLRKTAEAEDNATIYGGGAAPGVPQAGGPDGTGENADTLVSEAKRAQLEEKAAAASAVGETKRASELGAQAVGGEAKARDQGDALLQQRVEDGYNRVQETEAAVAEQSKAALDNYAKVNEEMHKLAVSQPSDLFGQAGVNKTLGTIAIFLGGAGINGEHSNRALDQFQGMADRTVAAQKAKFEMLSRVGQGDQTLYGMLQTKLQNKVAVENTLKSMAMEANISMAQQAANQFAGPKARANAAKLVADAKMAQTQLMQRTNASYLHTASQAVAIAAQHQQTQVQGDAALIAQAEKHQAGSLDGFVGWVPTKTEHTRLAKIVGGARNMVAVVNNMEALSHVQGSPTEKAAAYRKFLVDSAGQFLSARTLLETGTRLEEGELKMIAQFVPDISEASINNMSDKDVFALAAKMQQIRTVVTAIAANQVRTAAPRTMAFDSKDSLWGQYNPRTYRDPLIANGERNNPENPQAKSLSAMPDFPSSGGQFGGF